MAKVKPVGIAQEGLKVKTLRKVISRRLSDKKDSWNSGRMSPMAASRFKELCDVRTRETVFCVQEREPS